MRQLKRNTVNGTTLVSSAKLRPDTTSSRRILWCWPARVFITPVVPDTKPPCQSIVDTLAFQSPHVDMSDQIFQPLSGHALLATDVPYSAIDDLPERELRPRPRSWHARPPQSHSPSPDSAT